MERFRNCVKWIMFVLNGAVAEVSKKNMNKLMEKLPPTYAV